MAARASSGTGPSKTVVLGANSVVNTAALDFGNIIPATAAGTATVNAQTSVRSMSGVLPAGGGTPSAASFVASGTPNTVVSLSVSPSPIVLTNGTGGSMTVNQLRVSFNGGTQQPLGPNANTGPLGIINFAIGGRLNVGANQARGIYNGSFVVTMVYQ